MPNHASDPAGMFLAAFGQSPIGQMVIPGDGKDLILNEAARRLLDLSEGERFPSLEALLVPEDWSPVASMLETARSNPAQNYAFCCRMVGPGGEPMGIKGQARSLGPSGILLLTMDANQVAPATSANQLAHLYVAVIKTLSAMITERNRTALLDKICETLIASGDFCLAWIGWVDKANQMVRAIAVAGTQGMNYPREISVSFDESPQGLGPTGRAIRTGMPQVSQDIAADPQMEPWRKQALRAGFRSLASIPLVVESEVVGTLNVYSLEPTFFGTQAMDVLSDLARNLSLALEMLSIEHKRRQAENELAGQQKIFHSINKHIQDAIWIVDMSLCTTFVSPSVEQGLGYPQEELRGQPIGKQLTPDSNRRFLNFLSHGVTQETLQRREETLSKMLELEFIRKNGRILWGEIQVTLIRDSQGTAQGFLLVGRAISGRKRREKT